MSNATPSDPADTAPPDTPAPDATDPDGAEPELGAAPRRRRRLAPFIALAVALVLGSLFVVLATSKTSRSDEVSTFAVDKPAPQMIATTLDGKPFDLSRRKGSWVVLNFFNTTCLPCKAEHPELVTFDQQQQSLGVAGAELYTITWGADRESDVRAWFVDNGGDWPVVEDTNGKIAVSLGVAQVPETWIVDPQGVIVARIATTITADALSATVQKFRDQELDGGSTVGSADAGSDAGSTA
jgi:cytochrome c biogenesis protein CcmG, thiol:disulfide interchange protein DsbE